MKLTNTSSYVHALLILMLSAFVLSGCKTADAETEPDADPTAAKVENTAEEAVAESGNTDLAEEQTAEKEKNKQQAAKAEKGPGDGPAPTEETKEKLEEMEKSLAPIKAIPTAPKT